MEQAILERNACHLFLSKDPQRIGQTKPNQSGRKVDSISEIVPQLWHFLKFVGFVLGKALSKVSYFGKYHVLSVKDQ